MTSIGPFSLHVVLAAVAGLCGWLAARALPGPAAQRHAAARLVFDAMLLGVLAARASYVLRWASDYSARPLAIFALGDGGFDLWSGLAAACAFAWWRTRTQRSLRRTTLAGIAAGLLAWVGMQAAASLLQHAAPPLPDLVLATTDGGQASLRDHVGGPVMLNAWATWCPPCRREMPVLARIEQEYPGVTLLMVNQGENAAVIDAFLARQGLHYEHVLIDAFSDTMRALDTRILPATFFFDPQGRLVHAHLGELTIARARDLVSRHFGASATAPRKATVASPGG